jgi:hypothetical protein
MQTTYRLRYLLRAGSLPRAIAWPLLTVIVRPSEENSVRLQKQELAERHGIRQLWCSQLIKRPCAKLHSHITPGTYSWIGTSSGVRGLNLNCVVTQTDCAAELYIDRAKDAEADNSAIFEQLQAHRADIDGQVPCPISWEPLDSRPRLPPAHQRAGRLPGA